MALASRSCSSPGCSAGARSGAGHRRRRPRPNRLHGDRRGTAGRRPAASHADGAGRGTSAPRRDAEPAPAAPATPATRCAPANFVPGPGLPEDVVVAYAQNKAVVLLIVNDKGLEDKAVASSVTALEVARRRRALPGRRQGRRRLRADHRGRRDSAARPALVVIRPRKLTDNVPEATVSYGFRGPESVNQAVEDALFDGKNVTYYP